MIANIITDKDGFPIDGNGIKLSVSNYNPPEEIKKLFAQVQQDYSQAWRLQHRTFREFDDMSLLDRARKDQETFGAYVGVVYEPVAKQWRWKGRKNTARNKIIGILAHLLAGMLYPFCYAYNEDNEEDEMTARVMRIQVEHYLKKADYEIKFLYMITSALVNPAVHVEVEYVESMQRIKEIGKDGKAKVTEVVDILLSGINLNLIPIDQILPADFYTNDVQRQPNYARLRRIPYDEAKSIHSGKCFIDGIDQFDFVEAGRTRVMVAGQEHQTLYDIEWTEADRNMVQEITMYYRAEDLEVTFVGGVFIGNFDEKNPKEIYNLNPFHHRRMSMIGNDYKMIPIYPFAKSGFEPLDPVGRFYYYKSASFKEFWDDAGQNRMYQLAHDGTFLDVIKPQFMSGVAKIDQTVIVPGATIGMPLGATITPYSLGPNLAAALNMMKQNTDDMSESTQDTSIASGPNVTATATMKADQNARVILGVFGVMVADLIRQVGQLVMDCIIQHVTIGELDATEPSGVTMKYKQLVMNGKDNGKDVTNVIEYSPAMMGNISKEQANEMEWDLFYKKGGLNSKQRHYMVNPYKFARTQFSCYIDPDLIISHSMGTDQLRKDRAFGLLMDPRVQPYIDPEAVVDEYVLKEYSDGDPDKFKRKPGQPMSQPQPGQAPQPGQGNQPQPMPSGGSPQPSMLGSVMGGT